MTHAALPEGWLSLGRGPLRDGELYAAWADGGTRLQGIYQCQYKACGNGIIGNPPIEERVAPAPGYRAVRGEDRKWTTEPMVIGERSQ